VNLADEVVRSIKDIEWVCHRAANCRDHARRAIENNACSLPHDLAHGRHLSNNCGAGLIEEEESGKSRPLLHAALEKAQGLRRSAKWNWATGRATTRGS